MTGSSTAGDRHPHPPTPAADPEHRLRRAYAPVFLRYLAQRTEPSLHDAYELGRQAVVDGLSVLLLVHVHHAALIEVIETVHDRTELAELSEAASRFFAEVLGAFEMTQRGFLETYKRG
jgi:hypothetical protein